MAVMAYANYFNKIRFIFNLFDFDGNHSIDLDEIAIMVVWFLEGWGKIIADKMPPRRYIETFAEIIYAAAEFVPNGKITIKGIGDWVDGNENLISMLQTYEPNNEIEENSKIFLPLPRDDSHIKLLSAKYLGKHSLVTLKSDEFNNYSGMTKKQMKGKADDFSDGVRISQGKNASLAAKISLDQRRENQVKRRASSTEPISKEPEERKSLLFNKSLKNFKPARLSKDLSLPNIKHKSLHNVNK